MSELSEVEKKMQKNDDELENCVQLYVGLSWSEYVKLVGVDVNLCLPQLPGGMMDAADFFKMITEKELALNQCKARIAACTQQIEDLEKAEALIGQPIHTPGRHMKTQLVYTREQCTAEAKQFELERWRYSKIHVMDGRRFQAELSALLKIKLELAISHKKSIACRMLELRSAATL